jgi:DNA-binding GntR family transcriptional regulator
MTSGNKVRKDGDRHKMPVTTDPKGGPESPPVLLTPIPPDTSMADRAYYTLRDKLVSLLIPPGSLIRENALMAELKMSRTPIREALLRLAREGLIETLPRRGTFVTDVNVGDIGQIYEMRRELEVIAAGWAAERARPRDHPRIDFLLNELKTVPEGEENDARNLVDIDQRAHQLIWDLSGNRLIPELLSAYYYLAIRIWFVASVRVTMKEPVSGLPEVLRAVKRYDVESAKKYARRHSELAESTIRSAL